MKKPQVFRKIHDLKSLRILFWVCWAVYFLAYVGRLNFAASMVEIGVSQNYSSSQLGLVSTLMFFSYGGGQLFSGIIGDHVSPRVLVFIGVVGSAVCNLGVGLSGEFWQLAAIWAANGVFQSLIWSPIVRIFSLYMPTQYMYRSCINIQSSCALGSCSTYLLSSAIILGGGWRMIFIITTIFLFGAAVIWEIFIRRTEKVARKMGRDELDIAKEEPAGFEKISMGKLFLGSGLLVMMLAVLSIGILKEGVMTWVPEYVKSNFGVSSSLSIFLTAFLPLINLSGVFIIPLLQKRMHNETQVAGLMFLVAAGALGGLVLFGKFNLILSVLLFAIVTSCMMGTNTALISLVPTYFVKYNKTSTVVGILNSTCYVGSAISGYGIGLIAEKFGWGAAQLMWLGFGILGAGACVVIAPVWKKFKARL